MLLIRNEQMAMFRRQPWLRFETELAAYLKRYFPFEAANADLDRWTSTGLERATFYGFGTRRECALYLGLMAILGARFVEDPLIPWAAKTLLAAREPSLDRITRVFEKSVQYLDATGGPKCSWLIRAKLRVRKQDMSVLDGEVHPRARAARIGEALEWLYPQKVSAVGDKALREVVKLAIKRTAARGAASTRAALIDAVHMFFLGFGYLEDPCYPWTGTTLADPAVGPIEKRFVRMHDLSLAYLDRSFQFKS
jgi:hypothetical protein